MNNQHELHSAGTLVERTSETGELAWHETQPAAPLPHLTVREGDGAVWVAVDPRTGRLERTGDKQGAAACFRVVRRRLRDDLAMIALRPGILVNGLPALPLTVLALRDSVLLAPGCLAYVTERVLPFIGTPTGELVGRKCPFCRIAADAKTRIVTCPCGAVYHYETEESHPDVTEEDRLRCFEKVKTCLACGREMSKDEYLVWNPSDL